MKKAFFFLLALFLISGTAYAVPFQVTGSSVDVNWDSGGGIVSYNSYSMATATQLDEGQSFDFTFGQIFVPLAFGEGTADFNVNFSVPTFDDTVGDEADFSVWSIFIFSGGDLTFGEPVTFNYSYAGASGGMMTLDFDNLDGVQLGSWVDITGTITNSAAPVPEPATMLLLGTGLVGLAVGSRKKFFKK